MSEALFRVCYSPPIRATFVQLIFVFFQFFKIYSAMTWMYWLYLNSFQRLSQVR